MPFEVLAADSTSLQLRVDQELHYMLDSRCCLGKVTSIEPCRSTHPGLAVLRDRPAMKATLQILKAGDTPRT
jgi:hypothetical protein